MCVTVQACCQIRRSVKQCVCVCRWPHCVVLNGDSALKQALVEGYVLRVCLGTHPDGCRSAGTRWRSGMWPLLRGSSEGSVCLCALHTWDVPPSLHVLYPSVSLRDVCLAGFGTLGGARAVRAYYGGTGPSGVSTVTDAHRRCCSRRCRGDVWHHWKAQVKTGQIGEDASANKCDTKETLSYLYANVDKRFTWRQL